MVLPPCLLSTAGEKGVGGHGEMGIPKEKVGPDTNYIRKESSARGGGLQTPFQQNKVYKLCQQGAI